MCASMTCSTQKDLDRAIRLVEELLDTVEREYQGWLDDQNPPEEEKGEIKRRGRPEKLEKRVEVDTTDHGFEIKRRIIGPKGTHMHRICNEFHGKLMVRDDKRTGAIYVGAVLLLPTTTTPYLPLPTIM